MCTKIQIFGSFVECYPLFGTPILSGVNNQVICWDPHSLLSKNPKFWIFLKILICGSQIKKFFESQNFFFFFENFEKKMRAKISKILIHTSNYRVGLSKNEWYKMV